MMNQESTFEMTDLDIFDDTHLREIITPISGAVDPRTAGHALASAAGDDRSERAKLERLAARIERALPPDERCDFARARLENGETPDLGVEARHAVLNRLYWDLTYWKVPQEYERLTAGEPVHLGTLRVAGVDQAVVLDAGAGTGRVTLPLARRASRVYAMDSAPPMLRLLEAKILDASVDNVELLRGTFASIPLPDDSVDAVIACSAFGPLEARGGEAGLEELKRVTRPGGRIVIIWPEDIPWFSSHRFQCADFPAGRLTISFPTLEDGLCAARRFYAPSVIQYLEQTGIPEIPFSVIGVEEPRTCCWMTVRKEWPKPGKIALATALSLRGAGARTIAR
jgi:SAM-dependent methyltransferase